MRSPSPEIPIPDDLLPVDGRFGSGPSKIRPEALAALVEASPEIIGTSHRQAPVKFLVAALRNGLAELFSLPDGYEILLSNGGTHAVWDALVAGFIEQTSQHVVFGEFSSKFAEAVNTAPFLGEPQVIRADPGTACDAVAADDVDTYALIHNETSTGVAVTPVRPAGAQGLTVVDGTSGAGGLRVDLTECDLYYFAPQKCFASDGGLWLAAASPAALARIGQRAAATDRWVPAFLDLPTVVDNSRLDQTYTTPALATIALANEQTQWILQNGGLEWAAARCDQSASIIYGWADGHELATPFVTDPDLRSHVVATIDFDDTVDAARLAALLRENGIVDTEPYRKLGRNQLRIALYPAIDPADVQALTACIDHLLERM